VAAHGAAHVRTPLSLGAHCSAITEIRSLACEYDVARSPICRGAVELLEPLAVGESWKIGVWRSTR
jgi:hypothetical protein